MSVISEELYLEFSPDETLMIILEFSRVKDILNFGLTCKRAYRLTQDLRLWRFLVKRDWYFQYDAYVSNITKKNEESIQAQAMSDTINLEFVNIYRIQQELVASINKIRGISNLSQRDKSHISIVANFYKGKDDDEEENSNLNILLSDLTKPWHKKILSEPLIDKSEEDPIGLYKKFLRQSKKQKFSPTCVYVLTLGLRRGEVCNRPSVKGANFCTYCMMKPSFHLITDFNQIGNSLVPAAPHHC